MKLGGSITPTTILEHRIATANTVEEAGAMLLILLTEGYGVWTDGELYHVRERVDGIDGLTFHVYANEHPPPHFHVTSASLKASFTIKDCRLMQGNPSGRQVKLIEWWHRRSVGLLVSRWNATRPDGCPVGPIALGEQAD